MNIENSRGGPSWDAESVGAPERPSFVSSLAAEEHIERPRRVIVAFILVIVAVVGFVLVTAVAALRFDEVQGILIDTLPEDLKTDYSEEDVQRAARVLLAVVGGLGIVLTLMQALSAWTLVAKRNSGARVLLIIVTVIYLPVAVVAPAVRSDSDLNFALSGVAALSLLAAIVLVCTPLASQWLRQSEPRRSIPIAPLELRNES